MIYDVTNLKVGDYLRATDIICLSKAIITKGTKARVCATAGYGSHIGLEFETICMFPGGHDCFGSGKPGYCAWVPREIVSGSFVYEPITVHFDPDAIKEMVNKVYGSPIQMDIEKVIFNDPATIVFWRDGSKTVVKAENEPFDKEKGLAMAISKKALGNNGNYYNTFKDYIK